MTVRVCVSVSRCYQLSSSLVTSDAHFRLTKKKRFKHLKRFKFTNIYFIYPSIYKREMWGYFQFVICLIKVLTNIKNDYIKHDIINNKCLFHSLMELLVFLRRPTVCLRVLKRCSTFLHISVRLSSSEPADKP